MNHACSYLTIIAALAATMLPLPAQSALPAFPGAEGYGATATGGRGGTIYHVTNLDDAGPGSFRDAVSQSGRMVVFDVGGYVLPASPIAFANDLTVSGQTAPGDGFGIYGQGISLSGHSNIILRHIRVRQGILGERGKSSINMSGTKNAIVDHVSLEWGRWDCLDITSSLDITVQNSIIGEGVDPQRFGCLCESGHLTLKGNFWINNESRNPKGKGDPVQFINNVVYNWGVSGYVGGHSGAEQFADMLNNYLIAGPSSSTGGFLSLFAPTDIVYQSGNIVDLNLDGHLNGRLMTDADFIGKTATISATPRSAPPIPVTVHSVLDAYARIVAGAGASLHRDSVDTRLISDLTSLGTRGQLILNEATVGGPGLLNGGTPPTDSDGDGIPDAYELAHGLDPANPLDANLVSSTGYTNLEDYLNSLAADTPPANVSSSVAATASGFIFNRANQTFNDTISVRNTSSAPIPGPIEVLVTNLTPGVTLLNASGMNGSTPYLVVPDSGAGLAPGASLSVTAQFKNPAMKTINFGRITFSGAF